MKFGAMYEKAKELGCEYIATGHYAKMEYSDKYQRYVLKKADNIAKDQSYVLYNMPNYLLGKVLFPLGNFKSKDEVRKVAKENNLKVANKPDSEDICFVPDGNYKRFLEENSELKPKVGNIVTTKGEILGKHNGLYNYTIGQRKGLGISYRVPLFVVDFNKEKNELIVGEENEIYKNEMIVNDTNFILIDKLEKSMKVAVKTRYTSKETMANIERINDNMVKVIFDEPVARITPGQSAVFYVDDIVVGGGKIVN
jgi:tRNA-specific 2-thiouridylase